MYDGLETYNETGYEDVTETWNYLFMFNKNSNVVELSTLLTGLMFL